MIRLILALSAFLAVLFLSIPSAPAQGFAPIQADYDSYAGLFGASREPNLSPIGDEKLREQRRNNRWADYAEGNEEREPMLAAQVLMGISLTQYVDHQLTHQIETIIWHRFNLSAALAERVTLDRITAYLERMSPLVEAIREAKGITFDSDEEIQPIQRLIRDIHVMALDRVRNPRSLSQPRSTDMRTVRNLFDHGESHRNWVATYRFMREKFDVLDALADSFTFEDNRQKAFKYVVGFYESTEFHRKALEKIHHYFRTAAEQGNPIAQYHLALFLKYLGDIIDIDKDEITNYEKWLDQAGGADLAKDRVADAKTRLAEEAKEYIAAGRSAQTASKIEALVKLENEKMDMIEAVITRIVQIIVVQR